MNQKPALYVQDPRHRMPQVFLNKETYAQAIQSFPIVCADVLLTQREKQLVLLAHRIIKPMPGWWVFGGRIHAGELEHDAACRHLKADVGLDVDSTRLAFIGINRYLWSEREQEPQNIGSDNLAYTFALNVTDAEVALANKHLSGSEYDRNLGIRPFNMHDLVEERVHQAIVDMYGSAFS